MHELPSDGLGWRISESVDFPHGLIADRELATSLPEDYWKLLYLDVKVIA